jgi:thioesterase domain-containing protein
MVSGVYDELRSYATPAAPDGQPLPGFLKYAPRRILKVGASALIASARYRPGFYPGELTLFTAVEREHGLPSLEAIWSKHAQTLRIVETAGTHSTMLSPPNAQSAASLLTRLLPVMKPAP